MAFKMLVVGLTGGIGSGKSTAATFFADRGVTIVDSDLISHQLTQAQQPALKAIEREFGAAVLMPDGALNRAWLRELIHSKPAAKHQLEAILHPLILLECQRQIAASHSSYTLLMVPLLLEAKGFKALCDTIVAINCSNEVQIARVRQRNLLTEEQVIAIIQNQLSDAERSLHAQHLLYNNGSLSKLEAQVAQLHSHFQHISSNAAT
jgi:dephospho-CoA kinase